MFTSITGATGPSVYEEHVPKSSPPWVWVGFVFAGVFFVVGIISVLLAEEDAAFESGPFYTVLLLIGLASYAYWLFCIYKFHKILAQLTYGRYPISPGESVGKHFIPILSIIFIFQWPAELSNYINERGRVKMISGYVIGAMLLLAILLRWVDGSFGTAFLFGVTMYISAKLKKHVKTLETVTADQLPPLPDPRIFSQPLQDAAAPAQGVVEESGVR